MEELKAQLAQMCADMSVMISYMREIGAILGARDRLQRLDEQLERIQTRRTDPAPANGDTQ